MTTDEAQLYVTTLASVIGLVCNFRQERGARQGQAAAEVKQEREDFQTWLDDHKHFQLRKEIEGSRELQAQLDVLLRTNHTELLQRFAFIDSQLALILSRLEGFRGLSLAIHPQSELSDEAVSILKVFAASNSPNMHCIEDTAESRWILIFETDFPQHASSDVRFFHDNMRSLESLDYVVCTEMSSGKCSFNITRAGVRSAESLA